MAICGSLGFLVYLTIICMECQLPLLHASLMTCNSECAILIHCIFCLFQSVLLHVKMEGPSVQEPVLVPVQVASVGLAVKVSALNVT